LNNDRNNEHFAVVRRSSEFLRADTLTLVECRLHKEPQNVTWIEELM
jgi:hypothetical protein